MTSSGLSQENADKSPIPRTVFHETIVEKNFVYENEEEDHKEKSFDDVSFYTHETVALLFNLSGYNTDKDTAKGISLNILYCVFLI